MAAASPGGQITAIPRASVHRICTGQVVLDLATAVKELVENAIDAGATKVDVRLKEYGMDQIEVADNGKGIAPTNYESLALRHHTSKLASFEDLESMETFGFRGEALSALASLGVLSVTTRQAGEDVATALEFGRGGELLRRSAAARDTGTTATVAKIFSPLPVRHQEFKRNIKKEFSRLHDVLAGYCLVARDVRLTVTNVAKKGGRQSVLKTLGNGSLKDTVSGVFGIRQVNTLQPLHAHSEETGITLEGFVSKLGCGRSSGDRQLFSINSRPVDMSRLARSCNEVWRQFTSHQYPVVIINITMSRKNCDINVNPDKRQMLLHTETELRELLRDALTEAYAPPALSQGSGAAASSTPSAASWLLPQEQAGVDSGAVDNESRAADEDQEAAGTAAGGDAGETHTGRASSFSATADPEGGADEMERTHHVEHSDEQEEQEEQGQGRHDEEQEQRHQTSSAGRKSRGTAAASEDDQPHANLVSPVRASEQFPAQPTPSAAMTSPQAVEGAASAGSTQPFAAFSAGSSKQWVGTRTATDRSASGSLRKRAAADNAQAGITTFFHKGDGAGDHGDDEDDEADEEQREPSDVPEPASRWSSKRARRSPAREEEEPDMASQGESDSVFEPARGAAEVDAAAARRADSSAGPVAQNLGDADVIVDLDLAAVLSSAGGTGVSEPQHSVSKFLHANLAQEIRARRSSAGAADDKATHELARSLAKEDFEQMVVLGQFNRGFIIAKLRADLFIIDQHACDEKYNFETMQDTTKLHTQRMVNSMPLEVHFAFVAHRGHSFVSLSLSLSLSLSSLSLSHNLVLAGERRRRAGSVGPPRNHGSEWLRLRRRSLSAGGPAVAAEDCADEQVGHVRCG